MSTENSDGSDTDSELRRMINKTFEIQFTDRIAIGTLLLVSTLLAVSVLVVLNDDIHQYWETGYAIADGTYFVRESSRQVFADLFIRPPVYPIALWMSIQMFGKTLLAVVVPTILSSILFPAPVFLALRNLGLNTFRAFTSTTLLLIFPPFQIRALSMALLHALTLLILGIAFYYATVLLAKPDTRSSLLFGLFCGLAVLTRPEGAVYAGSLILIVTTYRRQIPYYAIAVFSVFAAIWSAMSWVVTDSFWYSSRTPAAYSLANTAELFGIIASEPVAYIELFSANVALSIIFLSIIGVLLLVGSRGLYERNPALLLLWLPILVNAAVLYLLPPESSFNVPIQFLHHHIYIMFFGAIIVALGWNQIQDATRLDTLVRWAAEFHAGLWIFLLVKPNYGNFLPFKNIFSLVDIIQNNVPLLRIENYRMLEGFRTYPENWGQQWHAFRELYRSVLDTPLPIISESGILIAGIIVAVVFFNYEIKRLLRRQSVDGHKSNS